jgi:hypothetical protein
LRIGFVDVSAVAVTAVQIMHRLKSSYGCSYSGTGHIKNFRQFSLRWKLVSVLKFIVPYEIEELTNDILTDCFFFNRS